MSTVISHTQSPTTLLLLWFLNFSGVMLEGRIKIWMLCKERPTPLCSTKCLSLSIIKHVVQHPRYEKITYFYLIFSPFILISISSCSIKWFLMMSLLLCFIAAKQNGCYMFHAFAEMPIRKNKKVKQERKTALFM